MANDIVSRVKHAASRNIIPHRLAQIVVKVRDGFVTAMATDGHRLAIARRAAHAGEPVRDFAIKTVDFPGDALSEFPKLEQVVREVELIQTTAFVLVPRSKLLDRIDAAARAQTAARLRELANKEAELRKRNARWGGKLFKMEAKDLAADRDSARKAPCVVLVPDRPDSIAVIARADFNAPSDPNVEIDAVGINARYLRDAVRACGGKNVRLTLRGEHYPVVVTPEKDDESFRAVVMPCRLRGRY